MMPSRKFRVLSLTLIAFLLLACDYSVSAGGVQISGQGSSTESPITSEPAGASPSPGSVSLPDKLGTRTKTSDCVSVNALPDPKCTPGEAFPDVTVQQICTPGYSSQVRNVTDSTKAKVYAEYGITEHVAGQYEVDHLVSLELGGSNGIANLWPEPAEPRPGFHEKDKLENYLHDQVCSGAISLQQAQIEIATNWLAVYQQMPGQ